LKTVIQSLDLAYFKGAMYLIKAPRDGQWSICIEASSDNIATESRFSSTKDLIELGFFHMHI
jgi:hypothetical protein